MPELKNTFTQGRMNKDTDERILPSSEYREALNIGVATSESSDVGAAQNILGNVKISCAIKGSNGKYSNSTHITAIANPMTDMIYRFVHTPAADVGVWMDRIIEFDTTKPITMPCSVTPTEGPRTGLLTALKEQAVLVDIYKVETTTEADSTHECDGADTEVVVTGNTFQLRHGMVINGGGIELDSFHVTNVEIIDTNSAKLTLSGFAGEIKSGELMTLEADRVLNFNTDRYITGINILDGMIYWTDNYSEPKKINIERSKLGSVVPLRTPAPLNYGLQSFDQHTKLIANELTPQDCVKIGPNICGGNVGISGCTSVKYVEYNPLATIDDGSCLTLIPVPPVTPREGCMDTGGAVPNTVYGANFGTNRPASWVGPASNYDILANISDPNLCLY